MLDCTGRQVQVTSSCTTALKALLTYQMHLQILCQDLHIGTHWASASQPSLPPASTARSPTAAPAHLPWPTCMHARSGAKRPSAIIVRIGANSVHRRRALHCTDLHGNGAGVPRHSNVFLETACVTGPILAAGTHRPAAPPTVAESEGPSLGRETVHSAMQRTRRNGGQ